MLAKGNLVVLESTSPVGTTEQIAAWLAEERPDLSFPQEAGEAADVAVAYFPERVLPEYLAALGVPCRIVEQDTYSVVKRVVPEGGTMCALCSRLRRGVLYRVASELGATRIALGHHRDDVLATFFLNLFYGGKLKAMPAKLVSDDGRHVVIRPMVYAREADLAAYAAERAFPIIPCTLCGSQANLQRQVVGEMLREWDRRHAGRIQSILRAMTDVRPSHLLDRKLFDFAGLSPTGRVEPDGDMAFDPPSFEGAAPLQPFAGEPAFAE